MWDLVHLLEAVTGSLRAAAAEEDLAQAVYGIDALDEVGLHPLVRQGLVAAGYGAWPERRYPSGRSRRRSEGRRCDLVLTPDGEPLDEPDAEATLFSPPDTVPLEAAYWLEIKTVSQFTPDGPFPHYSRELLSAAARDLRKLATDPLLFHAGLLLLFFTADRQTAVHDLRIWEQDVLRRGHPLGRPVRRDFSLTNRLGNGHATVALVPVRRL